MTAFDHLDTLDNRVVSALDEIAAPARPDYLDDVFQVTAQTRQRPRWTFPERWLPMDATLPRAAGRTGLPARALALVLILALVAALAALYVGSQQQRRPAPPFGPAVNGAIVYASNGDLHVRDSIGDAGRLLVGEAGDQTSPFYSPDGSRLAWVTTTAAGDQFMLAMADGSAARQVASIPPTGNAQAAWRPDSQAMGLIYDADGKPTLSIAGVDGTTRVIDLGELTPLDLAWRPPDGAELLVRAEGPAGTVDLYIVNGDGTNLRPFGLDGLSAFGPTYTWSGAVWSPDGGTIAVNAIEVDPTTLDSRFRVALMDGDGRNRRLVPGPSAPGVQEGWPAFSPDGRSILVHRWTWKANDGGEGWVAVLPADGSAPAHDIGPRVAGGEDTSITKSWSPDGTRVLMRTGNTQAVYAIDPVSGGFDAIDWTGELPDWQRVGP